VSLGKTLNAISHFGVKQSTRCGAQLDERHATEQLLMCWSDMIDTEHTTPGSNEATKGGNFHWSKVEHFGYLHDCKINGVVLYMARYIAGKWLNVKPTFRGVTRKTIWGGGNVSF